MRKHKFLTLMLAAVLAISLMVSIASAQTPYESMLTEVLEQLKADTPWGIVDVVGAFDLWIAEAAFFLDVRSSEDYEAGHIPGATLVPLETLPGNLDKLPQDKDALILVYCKTGWTASLGMMTLRLFGYVNVKGFSGSWLAWTEADHPITEGTAP
ncbi:rhodanese-like domain-containing protein [Candidatus Bipolaricaulota bacterium]